MTTCWAFNTTSAQGLGPESCSWLKEALSQWASVAFSSDSHLNSPALRPSIHTLRTLQPNCNACNEVNDKILGGALTNKSSQVSLPQISVKEEMESRASRFREEQVGGPEDPFYFYFIFLKIFLNLFFRERVREERRGRETSISCFSHAPN